MLRDLKDFRCKLPVCRFISLVFVCFTVTGCFESSFRLEQKIRDAVDQAKAGNTSSAVNKLENLQSKHPENAGVAEALGIVYQEKGDFMLASNYYQKAARLSPEKKHLQLDAAKNLFSASMEQDAAKQLKEYLESFPEDGESWLFLGRIQYDLQEKSGAMDSLTRGILLTDPESHTASDHQMLGRLYLGIGDFPQADYYLNKAITLADDPAVEGQALLGLIQSSVEQEDWDVADVFLKRLESTDPTLYGSEEAKPLLQTVVEAQRSRSGLYAEPEDEPEEEPVPPAPEPKEAVVESAEPDTAEPSTGEAVVTEEPGVQEAASIVEQEMVDEPEIAEEEVPSVPIEEVEPEEVIIDSPEAESEPDSESFEPYQPPENEAELLLVNSKSLIVEKQYAKAIRMTWDSINRNPESPAAWFLLSRAYAGYGQYLNAEAAALESMRLNPNNKRIVMNYLSVLQHSQKAERFHEELVNVYHRFNKDPDFILALARSYARIMNDPENAAVLYRRFLELEPDHDKATEVRAEIPFVE